MRPTRILALVDAAAIGVAAIALDRPSAITITYAVTTFVLMWACGAYRPRIYYRLSTQLPALLGQMTGSALLVSLWPDANRLALLERLPIMVGVVVAARLTTYSLVHLVRTRSSKSDGALIIGAGRQGYLVAEALLRHRGCGITPVGFVDRHATRPDSPLPVVADMARLDQVIERLGIKHLIVASPAGAESSNAHANAHGDASSHAHSDAHGTGDGGANGDRAPQFESESESESESAISTRLWRCQARDIDVWVVPSLFELGAERFGARADHVWGIPFQHLRRPGQYTCARLVKRVFDFAVAAALLVLTAPLLALVALVVRLTSAGPVFFRQTRIGQNGRQFELLKFRTMTVNDDSDTKWSVRNDRRMTPVGALLRRTSIDELPQVFNVIRGDMSLVGPRPERPYFDALFRATVPDYADRLRGPVGITGWAQIHGLRGDTSIVERTRFDNFYIEHWSLWLDVVIMVRTITALAQWMFAADGASGDSADSRPGSTPRTPLPVPANAGGGEP